MKGLKIYLLLLAAFAIISMSNLRVAAVNEVYPILLQPFDTVNDSFKITGIDSKPDATSDKIQAVGTLYDGVVGEYVIVSIEVRDRGQNYVVDLAWTMTPALTVDEEPSILAGESRYLIYYQDSSTKDVYLFDIGRGITNVNNIQATRFTLPAAYQSSFGIGYTSSYTGFVGIAANTFWFASYKSKTFDFKCQLKQYDAAAAIMSTCGSCSVTGTFNTNYFIVAGKFDDKLQLMKIQASNCNYNTDVTVDLPAPYVTADWYFQEAANTNDYYAAIARNSGSTTNVILYFIDASSWSDLRAKDVTLPNPIAYQKVQLDATSGTFYMNPMFLFITSANEVVVFEMQNLAGVHHFLKYDFPDPTNAVGLAYKGLCYTKEYEGGLIAGQITSFEDYTGATVTASASSGFFQGFEGVNSCTTYDGTWAATDETPTPYTALTGLTHSNKGAAEIIADTEVYTDTQITATVDFASASFANGVDYQEVLGACSTVLIVPPVVTDQYYVIMPSLTVDLDVSYGTFTYGPTSALAFGYTFPVTDYY